MNDDDRHDWVAHLLAATDHPPMPADVAERLDRTIRGHVSATSAATAPGTSAAAGTSTAAAGATPDASGPEPTGEAHAGEYADEADTGSPATSTGALGGLPVAPGITADSVAQRRADGVRAREQERDGVPEQATDTDADSAGPTEPSATPGVTRSGRTWGSSRRERREEDLGERRRKVLTRWVPVAAGVAVLGAAGVTAVNLLPGGGGDASTTEAGAADSAAEAVVPRALVATGTEYSTSDTEAFTAQVRDLVAAAGGAAGSEAAGGEAALEADASASGAADGAAEESAPLASGGADPAAARSVTDSPLSDPEELARCLDEVTAGGADTATAVDLAVVDGVESTVVVVPDPTGASYFVYVVGPDCSDTRFDFFTITP